MTTQHVPTAPDATTSSTPPITVIGWTLLFFAFIPLIMGGHGEGHTYLIVGGAMTAVSLACIAIGHFARRKPHGADS